MVIKNHFLPKFIPWNYYFRITFPRDTNAPTCTFDIIDMEVLLKMSLLKYQNRFSTKCFVLGFSFAGNSKSAFWFDITEIPKTNSSLGWCIAMRHHPISDEKGIVKAESCLSFSEGFRISISDLENCDSSRVQITERLMNFKQILNIEFNRKSWSISAA